MLKILVGLFILFVFFFTLAPKTNAYYAEVAGLGDYKDYTFVVNANNRNDTDPKVKDNPSNPEVDMYITAWKQGSSNPEPIFQTGNRYLMLITHQDTKCSVNVPVFVPPFTWETRPQVNTQLFYNFRTQGVGTVCHLRAGTYKLSLILEVPQDLVRKNYIDLFKDMPFIIDSQAGGEGAKIEYAEDNLVCQNRVTKVKLSNTTPGQDYKLWWSGDKDIWAWEGKATGNTQIVELSKGDNLIQPGQKPRLCLREGSWNKPSQGINSCDDKTPGRSLEFDYPLTPDRCNETKTTSCKATVAANELSTTSSSKRVSVSGFYFPTDTRDFRGVLINNSSSSQTPITLPQATTDGAVNGDLGVLPEGDYSFIFYRQSDPANASGVCKIDNITVDNSAVTGNTPPDAVKDLFCTEEKRKECQGQSLVCNEAIKSCDKGTTSSGEKCQYQNSTDPNLGGIDTIIGCVPTDPKLLFTGLMKYLVGISGSIALLMMIFGSFKMMTSRGNAEALKNGREQFTSAVIGLLFIIFSTLLLEVMTVDILGLPGFR